MTMPEVRTADKASTLDRLDLPGPQTEIPADGERAMGPHGGPLRVLVIGVNFSPEHTSVAPYTTQLCEYLVERGASVSVFTGVPHYPTWSVEPQYRRRLRRIERRDGLEVRRLRHYVPKRQTAIRRALYELSFALQVALQRPRQRPDVVLAVVPSLLSAVAAQRIAKRAGVPFVMWVQDLMGRAAAQSGIDGGDKVARIVGDVEKWILQRADNVLVISSHFADYVKSVGVHADRIILRPNWTHIAPSSDVNPEKTRARLGWRSDETIVLHTGNMGLKQGLQNVIAAARLADDRGITNVRFVLMGDGSQRESLQRSVKGIAAIQLLSPAPSEDYADILAATDILLVNERSSQINMSLPSKLTSYFRAGRPVIAASPLVGGTAAEIQRSGGGLVVEPEQPDMLLDAVTGLVADRESAVQMGKLGLKYAIDHLDADRALQCLFRALVNITQRKA